MVKRNHDTIRNLFIIGTKQEREAHKSGQLGPIFGKKEYLCPD